MIKNILRLISVLLLFPNTVFAETAYIIDKIQVGIHEESTLNSPILKLVGTGAQLDVIQRGVDMSEVVDPDGTKGWVNTAYLIDNKPGTTSNNNSQVADLEAKLQLSEAEINKLKTQLSESDNTLNNEEVTALRLRVGELQAKLTEERKKNNEATPTMDNNAIANMVEQNANLKQTIASLQSEIEQAQQTDTFAISKPLQEYWRWLLVPLFIGIFIGIFFYDQYKRHQHGGFRV